MNLWHVRDGRPSLADGVFVTYGPLGSLLLLLTVLDPFLRAFELRGHPYLGCTLLALLFLGLIAANLWLFARNERRIFPQLALPRRAVAIGAIPLFFVAKQLLLGWIYPDATSYRYAVAETERTLTLVLLAGLSPAYLVVMAAALRWPRRLETIAFFFVIGLSLLGAIARGYLALSRQR
jgi:hypothetical protein